MGFPIRIPQLRKQGQRQLDIFPEIATSEQVDFRQTPGDLQSDMGGIKISHIGDPIDQSFGCKS